MHGSLIYMQSNLSEDKGWTQKPKAELVRAPQLVMPQHCIDYRFGSCQQQSHYNVREVNKHNSRVGLWLVTIWEWGELLWRQLAKRSHPQNVAMWKFALPFRTKCFFVRLQWSWNSVISGRIGGEDPGGQLFFPKKPDAQMIHSFPMNTWFEVGRFQFVFCDSNGSINSLVRDERKLLSILVGSFIQAFSSSLTGPNFILTW